jgi:hypothetical protein
LLKAGRPLPFGKWSSRLYTCDCREGPKSRLLYGDGVSTCVRARNAAVEIATTSARNVSVDIYRFIDRLSL